MEIRECVAFGPTLSQHLHPHHQQLQSLSPLHHITYAPYKGHGGGLTENELDLGLLPSEGDANHDDLSCLSIGNVMQ